MNHSRPRKGRRGSSNSSVNVPHSDVPITGTAHQDLSNLTIPQLVDVLLSKIKLSDARTCIAESSNSPASVVAKLEQLQSQLLHLITTSRVYQNSFCPINMLPPEILLEIFHEVYPLPTNFPPSVDSYSCPDDLVKITHVCSHWRETALTCPSLWSTIYVSESRLQHVTAFLQRSMRTPLRIFGSGSGAYYRDGDVLSQVMEALGAHSHRFIECHLDDSAPYSDISELVVLPTPSLEAFSSHLYLCPSPPPLFADFTERLRRLAYQCSDDSWPWLATQCTNLRHLSLYVGSDLQTTASILAALRHMPLLEVLEVGLYVAKAKTDPAMQPVLLDRLRRLELGESAKTSMITSLLDFLVIPPTAEICIWFKPSYSRRTLPDMSAISKVGSHHWHGRFTQTTRIDISIPSPLGVAMSIKESRMILAPWSCKDVSECFPLPTWFPGRLEEIVLWVDNQKGEASVDDGVPFPRNIPRARTLTICGDDLDIVRRAVETASHKEDTSISLGSGSTTGKQVVGSQKYFQRVRSLPVPSEGPPHIFPTAFSDWMSRSY